MMRWQPVGTFLILGLFSWLFLSPIRAFERIPSFHSDITLNADTSITIHETIQYTTDQEKHGIYRYIPIRYSHNGLNYTAKVRDMRITDGQGADIPFDRNTEDGNVMFKIGDPDSTFTGKKTYRLSYTVENAVREVPVNEQLSPELYWDITGEGWQVDIASATATLHSPHAAITNVACYSGTFGDNDGQCTLVFQNERDVTFQYPQTITYGSNMTVALAVDPAGGIRFPTPAEKRWKQLRDNAGLLPLVLPGLIMMVWWWKRGRDWSFWSWNVFNHDPDRPQHRVPLWSSRDIPFVYEPLSDLTPGEAGALHDEKVDAQDVIAEIIDLARQKFLKIERTETKKLLRTETDYTFIKLKSATKKLPAHQVYLLEQLFSTSDTVKLSTLKGSFYTHMDKVKQMIMDSLSDKKLFLAHPTKTRGIAFGVALALVIPLGIWTILLLDRELFWALPLMGLSALLAFWFAYHMPAKSAKGYNLALQARGLRITIQRGAWREKIKEKHLFFEEVLPFAIALGVVHKLSRDMEQLQVTPPDYLAMTSASHWSTAQFVHSFSTAAASSLTYNPNSSHSSSGSGFSGGSSGGGGGGGGGGSW